MEENSAGGVGDDVTARLGNTSRAESIGYTPFPSTPAGTLARWSGGYSQHQDGHPYGGVPQWNKDMGFSQMQGADGKADEAFEEQVYIPNEGLVNSHRSIETTADTNYGETSPRDTHSQSSTQWDHFGAQFNSYDSVTYHEAAESDPIIHPSYTLNTVERNETSQDLPNLDLPLVDTHHHLPLYEYQRPSIVLSDPVGRTITPVADDLYCRMLGDESITTTGLVKQVRRILHGLNQKWMGRLKSSPDLYAHCMPLSTSGLLETGIRVLQECFSGTLPSTLKELFALMHVAFAFSIVINRDGDSYYWDGFSSDLHYWHHIIRDSEEISLFGKVWDRLWCPLSSNNHSFVNYPRANLYETLMEGMVIKGCKKFLDVVGHTKMAERRRGPTLPLTRDDLSVIDILFEDVTQRLTQCRAIREYWDQIIDTQSKLWKGLIRDVHEFELVLISRDTSSKTSSHVHSRYMKEVASQFDRIHINPDWRNESYTTYINVFLGQARESPVYLASKVDHCSPGLDPDCFMGTYAVTPSSSPSHPSSDRSVHHNKANMFPSSTNPTKGFNTTPSDISRPTSSSFTSPTDEFFYPNTSPATSIDLLSTTSGPTTPTPSTAGSESASSVTLCHLCPDIKYTGNPESQRRSLSRHNEEKHNNKDKLRCPSCGTAIASGRPDNLKRHLKRFNH